MKVLEAVHLLLFFPLFVVVVGVGCAGSRVSLHVHYGGMLEDEAITREAEKRANPAGVPPAGTQNGETVPRPGAPPATSQNFIEKIFQVPFWLRVMDPPAVRRLVHSLITTEELEVAPPVAHQAAAGTIVGPASSPPVASSGVATLPAFGTPPDNPALAKAKQITAEAETERPAIGESLAAPAEALKITEPDWRSWTRSLC